MTPEPRADRPVMPGYGIAPATAGGLRPWSEAVERLAAARDFWLSTADADGTPHLAKVWAVWCQDALHFSTGGRSRKARNLAARPGCSLGAQLAGAALVVEGSAHRHHDAAAIGRVASVYEERYGEAFPDTGENPLFALRPQVAIWTGEADDFVTTTTRWTFPAGTD